MKLALTNIIQSDLKSDIYNLTESTFSINEIIDVIKDIYPKMEMLFVNQNMKLRELKIEFDTRLNLLANFQKNALKEDLTDFKTQFTF
jgi:UDP-glucose 4-epimerase